MKQEQQREDHRKSGTFNLTEQHPDIYKRTVDIQSELFKRGVSWHNTFADECCPDFSCCDHKDQEVKTLQECKDDVARKSTYAPIISKDWKTLSHHLIQLGLSGDYTRLMDEAAELYAKSQSTQEELINACKYGYEFHATTSFPDLSFEDGCKNNFLQVLSNRPQSTQEWISVDDRLPESEGYYLCGKQYRPLSSFTQAVYEFKFYRMMETGELVVMDGETGVFQDGLAYGQDVTHWMPLPEPPIQ